jgi:putative tryptophan/tyrosine transport system substrate-binding protein
MQRRAFIALLGGAAVAWSFAARAQQAERMRLIGVLTSGTIADSPDTQARMAAFLQGLQHLGWADGRNVRIVYRSGLGDADNTRKYAAELALARPVSTNTKPFVL